MFQSSFHLRALACALVLTVQAVAAQAAFISLAPNDSNDTVTLAQLTSGELMGVTVGDKTFSEFFYSRIGGDMPAPADINVFGFQDDAGNYGVSFHGVFLDMPGGGPSDALLRFTVEVSAEAIKEGYRISDAHLYAGGLGLGEDSFFAIDESFQQSDKTLNVYGTTLNGPKETKLSDVVFFEQLHTKLRVTKDILAIAGDTGQPVRTTVIDQSFSQQVVPEPTTIGLAMIAALGMVAVRRKA
jgi:hypothetical protein